MSLSYPLSIPSSIGVASFELRAVNAVSTSMSPFTFSQQIIAHPGQRWELSATLPPLRRDLIAPWKAFLTALKGPVGTFLMGDPDYADPQGSVTFCNVTGTAGAETVSVVMLGTLKAGDYIQLGSGANSRLYQVLVDQTGNGVTSVDLEIWPALRATVSSTAATLTNPRGVFRLRSNMSSWSINNANAYGLSFEAVEAL
jgi:hypothetical protein